MALFDSALFDSAIFDTGETIRGPKRSRDYPTRLSSITRATAYKTKSMKRL